MYALDLFCGGGGAGNGLQQAGFQVTGVDVNDYSQYYPGDFVLSSITELDSQWITSFDFVWASPPCKRASKATKRWGSEVVEAHPDLIGITRELLSAAGVPFVIENVPQAPIRQDLMLCGGMFSLDRLRRHRSFELHGFGVPQPEHPKHVGKAITVAGHPGGRSTRDGQLSSLQEWKDAMGITWLPASLLAQAIPPAYSQYIAQHFQQHTAVENTYPNM